MPTIKNHAGPSLLIPVILLIVVVGAAIGWYMYTEAKYKELIAATAGSGNTPFSVDIEKGSSIGAIANLLKGKDLIVDRDAFIRYAKEKGDDAKLQAGTFSVTSGLTIPEVLDVLTGRTKPTRTRVIIREGLTIRDIAGVLVSQGLIKNEDEFYDCITTCDFSSFTFLPPKNKSTYAFPYSYMEGYMFPDTYFVDTADFKVETFIAQTLRNFDTKVVKGLAKQIAASDYSLEELVTMASIVEKESRPADNQAVVAGILWKRLENNVQLAADATNRYIKEDPTGPLYQAELTSNNPYNGRKIKGLPPSAISNPGLASLKAAISPETSDWWYYLHDANGTIRFARTEAEHERNKSLYLQ